MRMLWLASLLGVMVGASGLPAQQADTAPPPPPPRPPKSSSTLITAEDIERVRPSVGSAYDAVQLLRPRWLKAREILTLPSSGADMRMQEIHVYLDDRDMGDLDFLKSIPAGQVYTLQFMSLTETSVRFGASSGPGIVLTLRR